MIIYTARVGYKGIFREHALDITVKSGKGAGQMFAPTRPLLNSYKYGPMTWEQYREGYLELLRGRYSGMARYVMDAVTKEQTVVLLCYCRDSYHGDRKCHRYLAAEVLLAIAKANGIIATYKGEIYD